jgi:hypothetical protein
MTHKFNYENDEYEIRSAAFDTKYEAAVFFQNRKLCSNFSVSFEMASDFNKTTGKNMLNEIIKILESEVRNGNIKK